MELETLLARDSGIDDGYVHITKRVTAREQASTGAACFKWYDVHPPDREVPGEITRLARAAVAAATTPGFGFVILHRCGSDFYFLILVTWRNNNEAWSTVYYKDATMQDFALFAREGEHKPAFCVWELVPVWHEQQAWSRFLRSSRDARAAGEWQRDLYEGEA